VTLKTRAEIQQLIQIRDEIFDTDRDGEVSETEFLDNYVHVADELVSFGIETAKDLGYWTTDYKPGTEVLKAPDGEYDVIANPVSRRYGAMTDYRNGELADAALRIEGSQPESVALLSSLEGEWDDFYRTVANLSLEKIREEFANQVESPVWESIWYSGLDPKGIAGAFTDEDLDALKNGIILQMFFKEKNISYRQEQKNFGNFLAQHGARNGNCNVLCTLALHLLQRIDDLNFAPILIPNHVTLAVKTSLGTLYLDPALGMGFKTPEYYDKRGTKTVERRSLEMPVEPWEILAVAHLDTAIAKRSHGDMDGYIHELEISLEICPKNPMAHYDLGMALAERGDAKSAREHFRKALESSPGFEPALRAFNGTP
jgi:regulator of sirC expression with transglutaminase-like and TPR domain